MTYVLIPGAGGDAWYWHLIERELQERGHDTVAVEVPTDDDGAGLDEYTDAVVEAIGDRRDLVLVAQSMGAFLVPLVHERRPARRIVLVNAMIPLPGETPGAWWGDTGQSQAQRESDEQAGRDPDAEFDLATTFFHDVPAELTEFALGNGKRQADRVFGDRCAFSAWPAVPTRVVTSRDDRFFPAAFQRRVARDRLDLEVEMIPGGHLVALSYPTELVEQLVDEPTQA